MFIVSNAVLNTGNLLRKHISAALIRHKNGSFVRKWYISLTAVIISLSILKHHVYFKYIKSLLKTQKMCIHWIYIYMMLIYIVVLIIYTNC